MIIDGGVRAIELQEKIGKLPKWAQQHIDKLASDVEYHKARQDLVEVGDTDTFITDYVDGDKPLPPGSSIRFMLKDGWVECATNDGILEIYGDSAVAIMPRAANMFRISTGSKQ